MDRSTTRRVKGLCAVAAAVMASAPAVVGYAQEQTPEVGGGFRAETVVEEVAPSSSFISGGEQLALAPPRPPRPGASSAAAGGATTQPTTASAAGGATTTQATGGTGAVVVVDPVAAEVTRRQELAPLGNAGRTVKDPFHGGHGGHAESGTGRSDPSPDFLPIPDRWRIGVPGDYVQNMRSPGWFNPYTQNVLKGDYPIIGQDKFLIVTLTSDTLFESRRIPVPSNVAAAGEGSFDFFGSGHQQLFIQNGIVSVEFFEGDAAYKPRDWEFKATVVGQFNYVHTDELSLVAPDPRQGRDRHDDQIAFQELFFDKHMGDLTPKYDIWSIRMGIQGFVSDFRGFLFADNEPGVRITANWDDNRLIGNLAWFHLFEKDTNSGLNSFTLRDQDVFIANLYREDFIWRGYTAQVSAQYNWDRSGNDLQYDKNGFIVRPQPIGTIGPKENRILYLGWAGDGHIGRFNITHQFYQALGSETFNPIADQGTHVNAQFAAIEVSYDIDWIRLRSSFAYVSGDRDPFDDEAQGFDAIFENPNFAGGGFSYFVRQAIPLTGGGTGLTGRQSLFPALRTSKEQGQSNFVNPGLFLYNIGADFEITPRVKLITNASYLQFADTGVLQVLLFDDKIGRDIGYDLSVGVQWRPLNNQNVIFTVGAAMLIPGNGFQDIYTSETLYSTFLSATITY